MSGWKWPPPPVAPKIEAGQAIHCVAPVIIYLIVSYKPALPI